MALALSCSELSPVSATVLKPFVLNNKESSTASIFPEQNIKPRVIPLSLP
jgi:hypothetical protein